MLKWSCRFALYPMKNLLFSKSLRWNHYHCLGLESSATMPEIKAAYYNLSKKYHPDLNNGSEASAKKFRDIVAAYEVLSKPNSKVEYDREIARGYGSKKHNFGTKTAVKKKIKKNSNTLKSKSRYKNKMHPKYKLKNGLGSAGKKGKIKRKYHQEDLENLIINSIPFVISYLVLSKKH